MRNDYAGWGRAVARRLWSLFVVRLRLAWAVLFVWANHFGAAFVFYADPEKGLRVNGAALQLFGLLMVLVEIDSTRQFFGKRGLVDGVREWWASLKRAFLSPKVFHESIVIPTATAVATGYPPDVVVANSLEERVALLAEDLQRVRNDLSDLRSALQKVGADLATERSERQRGIAELDQKIGEHATKDLHVAALGVLFVLAGMLMSTLAPDLAALTRG